MALTEPAATLSRINRDIHSSLKSGRDLPGTIADLRKLMRRAQGEERVYYKAAVGAAKFQLRLCDRPY